MQKLSDITDKFKMTKFRVQMTAQAAIDVQKAMFIMGFRDYYSQSGQPRVARTVDTFNAKTIHSFFIDKDNRIECTGSPGIFNDPNLSAYREISILEVFEASKQYAQLKRELRAVRQAEKRAIREAAEAATPKQPKKPRKKTISLADMVAGIVMDAGGKEVDSDGYTVWDGKRDGKTYVASNEDLGGPVPRGTRVDVKYRNGDVQLNGIAGDVRGPNSAKGYYPAGSFWHNDGKHNDIVAYRLSKPELTLVPMEPAYVPVGEVTSIPDTNPKRQFGVQSVPLNMWSPLASAYGALGLYNGSLKYGKANFANTPVEASIYIAAAFRHLSAWASGQEFDPADGVPNLGGVLANVAILLEARAAGMLIDDRLKMDGYLKEIDALKEIVKQLNILHAGKAPHHYTVGG